MPVRKFRAHLADLLDQVADRREHVAVTRRGRPAAVLALVDEYGALEETAEILSDEDTLARSAAASMTLLPATSCRSIKSVPNTPPATVPSRTGLPHTHGP